MDIKGFGPIDIAVSGLKSHMKNIETISSNVANARTTDAGNGQPYRRLETVFKVRQEGITPVEIAKIAEDNSEFQRIFDPGNPMADEQGYLSMPNVNLPIEMMNLNLASRSYQANTAVLKRYQKMVETTLELLR